MFWNGTEKDLMRGIMVASDDYYPALALTILRGFLRKPFGTLAPVRQRKQHFFT
jgi:hypothetical protein